MYVLNKKLSIIALALSASFLTACGGGSGGASGGESSSNTATSTGTSNEVQTSTPTPTPEPTPAATPEPTPEATPEPTPEATPEPVQNFDPDDSLLQADADDSMGLYVEPEFQFEMEKSVQFYFLVVNANAEPASDVLVKVYAVPSDTESLETLSSVDKSLVFVGKTNANGLVDRQVDISPETKKVLVVTTLVGVENKAIIEVGSDGINYNFGG